MQKKTCERCNGSKEVINLGLMRGPCKVCDAKGYIIAEKKIEPIIKTRAKRTMSRNNKPNDEDPKAA